MSSPEGKARLEQAQIATLPSYLVESMPRTRKILESCEDEKNVKRAHIQVPVSKIWKATSMLTMGFSLMEGRRPCLNGKTAMETNRTYYKYRGIKSSGLIHK